MLQPTVASVSSIHSSRPGGPGTVEGYLLTLREADETSMTEVKRLVQRQFTIFERFPLSERPRLIPALSELIACGQSIAEFGKAENLFSVLETPVSEADKTEVTTLIQEGVKKRQNGTLDDPYTVEHDREEMRKSTGTGCEGAREFR